VSFDEFASVIVNADHCIIDALVLYSRWLDVFSGTGTSATPRRHCGAGPFLDSIFTAFLNSANWNSPSQDANVENRLVLGNPQLVWMKCCAFSSFRGILT
jgi:predicted nuclease of predicted toxin-antitoxin system